MSPVPNPHSSQQALLCPSFSICSPERISLPAWHSCLLPGPILSSQPPRCPPAFHWPLHGSDDPNLHSTFSHLMPEKQAKAPSATYCGRDQPYATPPDPVGSGLGLHNASLSLTSPRAWHVFLVPQLHSEQPSIAWGPPRPPASNMSSALCNLTL